MILNTPSARRSFYLLSLGCAKNLVDAECMSRILVDSGWQSVAQPEQAEALIVNTCGFIAAAKQEAIDAILNLADYKQPAGPARFLIVTGCLTQRYARQIRRHMPEVDALLGTGEYDRIGIVLNQLSQSGTRADFTRQPGPAGSLAHLKVHRQPATPSTYAYIKIAEGCSNHCAYCAIPAIRGEYVSRPLADILDEARRLSAAGYGELILIAQDTGRYGLDLTGDRLLPDLVTQICQLPDVRLVRILYTYSDGVTPELIQVMARETKVAHYLDLPIQHGSERILQLMNRHDRPDSILQVVSSLRAAMPDLILRSTIMLGFPGETEADVDALCDFLAELRFDRLGCFIFSPEEGTPAFSLRPRVHYRTAARRQRRVMAVQGQIAQSAAMRRIGSIIPVTLESVDDSGIFYIGRSYGEAPDVDPVIHVVATSPDLLPGQTCFVRLTDGDAYSMTGVSVP